MLVPAKNIDFDPAPLSRYWGSFHQNFRDGWVNPRGQFMGDLEITSIFHRITEKTDKTFPTEVGTC